jgi:DNA-directed RNA polymerase specialized sigma24 family protein
MDDREARFAAWKQRPDGTTLAALLEIHLGRIQAICRAVLRDPHDAEEAAQESLLKMAAGLDRVADAGHFERWSATVAIRTAIDFKRSRARRRSHEALAASARY